MADDNVQSVQDQLLNDDSVLEQFKQAPHQVLADHGVELTEAQREKLAAQNLHELESEAVRRRIRQHGLSAMY
jgi:hypothetical protein